MKKHGDPEMTHAAATGQLPEEQKKNAVYGENVSWEAMGVRDPARSSVVRPFPKSANINISVGDFLKLIYNANPFYLISAGLVLYAATLIFNTANIWLETAVPIGLIAAYTALLTATVIFVVRQGKVWTDARSILFIIISLLFVLSASIDQKAMDLPYIGLAWLGGGFLFAAIITETLKTGLKIRLPRLFWTVYYLFMGLFFFYPFLLGMLVRTFEQNKTPAIRAIMFFPVIAGMLLLLLVPLVRKGHAAVRNNGTPWKWPYFPWSIFVITALTACFRTYLFSISFYGGRGVGGFSRLETGFAGYMLIPIVLASLILLLEWSLTAKSRWQVFGAMLAPAVLFLLCVQFGCSVHLYRKFLLVGVGLKSSPLVLVLLALAVFYAYAWYRKVKFSEYLLAAALFGVMGFTLKTGWLESYGIYGMTPGAIALLALAWSAYRNQDSLAYTLLSFGTVGFCTAFLRDTAFLSYHGAMPINLGFALMLLIGWFGNDPLAKVIRYVSAALVPLFFGVALFGGTAIGAPVWAVSGYLVMLFAISLWNCLAYRRLGYYVASGINLLLLAVFGSIHCFNWITLHEVRGLKALFWGIVFFLAALLISLIKGGILQRWVKALHAAQHN